MNVSASLLSLTKSDPSVRGTIALPGSKSISNRALLICQLAGASGRELLTNLSSAQDTRTLLQLLEHDGDIFNAGDAGTTFRFMAAYLALLPEPAVLTGSPRMLQRPVGPLVQALRTLGAQIEYLGREGYPPLGIRATPQLGRAGRTVRIPAGVSSQFLSALLMIGPRLSEGLELIPEGPMVSRPYLDMTLGIMRRFGAQAGWQGDGIAVAPGDYRARPFTVEGDWSAASYWYAMAALSDEADILLKGLQENSLQGDSVLAEMMRRFDVQTTYEPGGVRLQRGGGAIDPVFEWDFTDCPDLAQTLAVVCAAKGVRGVFSGLETLYIKETDRVGALQNELAKVGVRFTGAPGGSRFTVEGRIQWPEKPPRFATYGDHRMAMAFAPLALLGPVGIESPDVVGKSYPDFWEHLRLTGFETSLNAIQKDDV